MPFSSLAEFYGLRLVAADVEAAFMQGDPQHGDQELYMSKPK